MVMDRRRYRGVVPDGPMSEYFLQAPLHQLPFKKYLLTKHFTKKEPTTNKPNQPVGVKMQEYPDNPYPGQSWHQVYEQQPHYPVVHGE